MCITPTTFTSLQKTKIRVALSLSSEHCFHWRRAAENLWGRQNFNVSAKEFIWISYFVILNKNSNYLIQYRCWHLCEWKQLWRSTETAIPILWVTINLICSNQVHLGLHAVSLARWKTIFCYFCASNNHELFRIRNWFLF